MKKINFDLIPSNFEVSYRNGVLRHVREKDRSVCFGETVSELLADVKSNEHKNIERYLILSKKYKGEEGEV